MTPPNHFQDSPSPFDLGYEIGEIRGGINALLERTKDLSDIRDTVAKHERDIRLAKKVGWWVGGGVVTAILAKFGIHLSPPHF